MHNKPEIVFTFPDCMGGVSSFNFNIINFSRLIKKFRSKVILIRALEDKLPLFLEKFNVDEVVVFEFSYKENRYHVMKRLNALFGTSPGSIVTDNSLTIFAARQFNNPKTIYHLVHDYFYVNEVGACGDMTDVVIAHSSFFSDAVFASSPALFFNRCFYIPYGVQQLPEFPEKNNKVLKLVFLGRLDKSKGVELLFEINTGLKERNIQIDWTVIGKGPLKGFLKKQWDGLHNIAFYEPDSTAEVYKLLSSQDILVFPTSFEGTPVAIMESVANGIVTITNDLPGGIRDIVTEGIGYRCSMNDIPEYVSIISSLHHNRERLREMQNNCYQLAKNKYDIIKNADHYFEKFLQFESFKRDKKTSSVRLSRMDKAIYPNMLVKMIRNFK